MDGFERALSAMGRASSFVPSNEYSAYAPEIPMECAIDLEMDGGQDAEGELDASGRAPRMSGPLI